MKKVCIFILFLFVGYLTNAQVNFEKSDPFTEFDGWTKLIQLRNGNTGLMEYTKKKGINFTLFSPDRKTIISGKLPLKKLADNYYSVKINGVYDISGDYVFFITDVHPENSSRYAFYRIIVDGSLGIVKSEEVIDDFPEMTMSSGYGMPFSEGETPTFTVEKDPETDFYAVIRYNTTAKETKDRIIVSHFGPDHKLINKANYNTPADKYKYVRFLTAYVHAGDYVLLSTCGYNTNKSGGEEIRYYVAQLNSGKVSFLQKELSFTEYTKSAQCFFLFNKPKENIVMVMIIDNVQVNQNINPTSLELGKPFFMDWTNVNSKYMKQMDTKKDYSGMIQGAFVDSMGNIIFVYQKTTNIKLQYGEMATQLEDVALVTISNEGKEISSAFFRCGIYRWGNYASFAYNNSIKGFRTYMGPPVSGSRDWYMGINVVSTKNATYLFLNNSIENMEMPDTKQADLLTRISGLQGVKYTYSNEKVTKEFVFGNPARKKEAKFINPEASHYNGALGSLATILTDPETKKANVVWMKLE